MRTRLVVVLGLVGVWGCGAPPEEATPAAALVEVPAKEQPGFLARVELGSKHVFEMFEDEGAISYSEEGGPGTRPTGLLVGAKLDELSPRDVFELLAPGRQLPAGLEKYPRTNAPRAALQAELVQQKAIVEETLTNTANNGPCPWSFFRDTSTALGPLCISQGSPYEWANCWENAGWMDASAASNKRAMAAICVVGEVMGLDVRVNQPDNPARMFTVGQGRWRQYKVTGTCSGTIFNRVCNAPWVRFNTSSLGQTSHMSFGFDAWPGG